LRHRGPALELARINDLSAVRQRLAEGRRGTTSAGWPPFTL